MCLFSEKADETVMNVIVLPLLPRQYADVVTRKMDLRINGCVEDIDLIHVEVL